MIGQLWSALAAIGSGLILMAVAAGAERWLALPLIAAAIAEFVWGILVMRAGRLLAPRAAMVACGIMLVAATALLFTREIGLAPFLALIGLHWVTAVFAALRLRRAVGHPSRGGGSEGGSRGGGGGAFVLTLTAQALIVAAVTTPALADTEAGSAAVPHGTSTHGNH